MSPDISSLGFNEHVWAVARERLSGVHCAAESVWITGVNSRVVPGAGIGLPAHVAAGDFELVS